MTWWAWLWMAVLALWSLAGIWDDWRAGRLLAAVIGSSGLLCCVCVAAFADASVARFLGRALFPIATAAAAGTTAETYLDVRDLANESDSAAEIAVSIVAVGLVFGTAIAAGFVTAIEVW